MTRVPHRFLSVAGLLLAPPIVRAAEAAAPAAAAFPSIPLKIGLALALFAGWIALVWWCRVTLLARLRNLAVTSTRGIASLKLRRISLRQLVRLSELAVRLISLALFLGGTFVFAVAALELIPATQELAGNIEHYAFEELVALAQAAASALPGLIVVAVIFFITRVTHELLNHYFRSIISGEVKSSLFDPVSADTTRRLGDAGLWICAVIIAFPYVPGSESAAFRGVTVLAGLMITVGSANLVSQFTSQISLVYGRMLRPGEYVQIGTNEGVVESVGLLASTIRTPRDELIVLPNATVASGLKNYSRGSTGVRLDATITIGYDTPWRQVRDLLLAAAAATPGICRDPAPLVRQANLEDFYVRYELLFVPDDVTQRMALLGRLHEEIQDRFHAAGVQIMSPHYTRDPSAPKLPPKPAG